MADTTTIPERRNWAHDPRAQTLTHTFASGTGSTEAVVTDRSFSGPNSVLGTIVAGERLDTFLHITSGNAIYATIPDAATIYGAVYLSGPATDLEVNFHVDYTDGTSDWPTNPNFNLVGTDFQRVDVPPITIASGKVVSRARIMIRNLATATQLIYLGGTDISVNQEVDAFISGAGGANYSWEGAANDSPSNRAAFTVGPVLGSGGQISPSIRVYVVNRQNQILREITEHFIDGNVNYDLDAEQWKGSCTLVLDEPGLIKPLVDEYVRTTLRIEKPDGSIEEGSLGLFNMDAPTERWSGGHDSWTYEGKDMLSLLATTTVPAIPAAGQPGELASGFIVPPGGSWLQYISDLLILFMKFNAAQFSFAGLTGAATLPVAWEEGDSILTMLTDMLQGAGWQKPWVTPEGIITSAVAGLDPARVTPSLVLATGENSQIRWPFEVDPETSRVGNRVRVVGTKVVTHAPTIVDPPGYWEETKKKRRRKKRN